MKRDMELIRKLVLLFRDKEGPGMIKDPEVDGYDREAIKYHCVLLHDAGLLRCEVIKSKTSDRTVDVWPFELTWDGHEFADKIASDTIWKKIRQKVGANGGALVYNVINRLASQYALEAVDLN